MAPPPPPPPPHQSVASATGPGPRPEVWDRMYARTFDDFIAGLVGGAVVPVYDIQAALRSQGYSDLAIGWMLGFLTLLPHQVGECKRSENGDALLHPGAIVMRFVRDDRTHADPDVGGRLLGLMRTLDGHWSDAPDRRGSAA